MKFTCHNDVSARPTSAESAWERRRLAGLSDEKRAGGTPVLPVMALGFRDARDSVQSFGFPVRNKRTAGFSMIEIAIALGVIAFALVAIIGILPFGLTVQRDNRAETIINQDATYWLEAIRNGAQGLDDLTNYVDQIVLENEPNNPPYTFGAGGIDSRQFTSGRDIVSLLTQPFINTNVTAYVRAISGAAAEKGSDLAAKDFAFKYQIKVDLLNAANPLLPISLNNPPPTLYELRLALAWPVKQGNTAPLSSRPPLLYRTMLSRDLRSWFTNSSGQIFYLLEP